MSWNWQKKGWPNFIYSGEDFTSFERQFFENSGKIHGSIKHIDNPEHQLLKVELLSEEAYRTSEIEGEFLNRDSIQSSIRRHFNLQTDHRKIPPAELGISEMMIDLYKNYQRPLDDKTLCAWHEMIMKGRADLTDIGRYRNHEDPMQIVSGPIYRPNIHFEAPPSSNVPKEMGHFLNWFNSNEKNSTLIKAALAHLHFESIHPFEDGNGRIGRAISEKTLSQGLGRPTLLALSLTIATERSTYYTVLEANNKALEVNGWIEYFCNTVLKAQEYTQQMIDFIIKKGKYYALFSNQLNDRQLKVVNRIFDEGIKGFEGGLSAKNYMTIAKAPSATATRDLTRMVEIGAMTKRGQLKGTRYHLKL